MAFSTASRAWETLDVQTPAPGVVTVTLNRPDKSNAMNRAMWRELREAFAAVDGDPDARVVVLSGAGKHFTSGLDLADHAEVLLGGGDAKADPSRTAWRLHGFIEAYQASVSALERCRKPVLAAVHGACIGGGVDLISAADIRYASADATFCIKEAALGLAADVGTLQRLPRVVRSDSWAREAVFTARAFGADEAAREGLVSRVCVDAAALREAALETARRVAALSPVAVQGSKVNLNYAREHGIARGLEFQAAWNAAMLQTADIPAAAEAMMTRGAAPTFAKL
jgi:delta(3,5)-delta(2,4)-dienoyl-CoA isomerase